MKTRPLGAAGAVLIALTAVPAQAQQIVHDPTAYARMIEDARTALEQLQALKTQIDQGERLFDSLNALSDVNALADQLGLAEVRDPLPDLTALRAAAEGDLSALGDLADRAEAIRRETRVYTPSGDTEDADEAERVEALERAGRRTARDLAVGEAVDAAAEARLEGLETLRLGLDTAPNARAVLELQARLTAEQALIQNEQLRLQGLALVQAAEERLEEQRTRERAEADRDARLRAYQRAFP